MAVYPAALRDLPAREWLAGLFAQDALSTLDRASLLAGRAKTNGGDAGPTICSCFGVGRETICAAIRDPRSASASWRTWLA